MSTSESFRALRRANPRNREEFAAVVEATGHLLRARLAGGVEPAPPAAARRGLVRVSAGAALAAASAAVTLFALGMPGHGSGVQDATAAVQKAAAVTAASARDSGTVVVRITHGNDVWGDTRIRWNGDDLSLYSPLRDRSGKVGAEMRLVDGMLYGIDPEDGAWVEMGPATSIDADSGTTPDEYLAAAREDVGGATLRRIASAMSHPATTELGDGSTVYSGDVAAGVIARETGVKGGRSIRVLPFGFAANGAAADADAPLHTAVTVGPDGVVRQIDISWGTWSYAVHYDGLGTTPAPVAPLNARPLKR